MDHLKLPKLELILSLFSFHRIPEHILQLIFHEFNYILDHDHNYWHSHLTMMSPMNMRKIRIVWTHGDFLNGKLSILLSANWAINSIYTPLFAASLLITSISDSIRLNSSHKPSRIFTEANTARYCCKLVNITIKGLTYVFSGDVMYFLMPFHLKYTYELISSLFGGLNAWWFPNSR